MDKQARQLAKAAFQKQKVTAGIFRITCRPTGEAWIGKSRNLESVMNRLSLTVQSAPHVNAQLRAAWHEYGKTSFNFESVEELDPETPSVFINSTLKERLDHWKAKTGAISL
ncbi:MAG: hypothetical protein CMK06_07070 [Ponticaulis sp.]|nr:hypothetical protein [Ponticaulis sp.]|tara:strand:+ start:259 stop:594 length:336 start_codon:yes stop_codon:yes gene_type:complete